MDTQKLSEILSKEIEWYAPGFDNANTYVVKDEAKQMYAVLIAPHSDPDALSIMIAAHIEDDVIYIDKNRTDQPLSGRLQNEGVPAAQIVSTRRVPSLLPTA